ncbi:MAG: DNA gyrase subunit A [Chitinivibrionales bacterium]|nr:DNA gyrase subunit A [Chitinivibrionales bacterium]MBD3393997.1 DNA gyrase subunit A [Chitinivibrionales bacterium]
MENAIRAGWVFIEDELQKSYLDYSMSMITSRALPDVRDGLKPVHRRVLLGLQDIGLQPTKPPKKCANVVGNVMAKYHPHGDSAIYDTIVRMAQDFSLRYPMVDGQGNFGSIDGDPAAAYRYTECRMTRLAEDMLADLEKETVDLTPNYDGSTEEPVVLPAKLPFLLVNGSTGIAVGMATNMPPHNLGEVVDAVIAVIDNPQIDLRELLTIVPGPDFPTGGIIYGKTGIMEAYARGRGRVVLRARAEVEKSGEREHVIVTEIPYMVNKSALLERMGELVREKTIEGVSFIRDESDRRGMRIVIGIRKDAFGDVVLNKLYKYTALQSTFGVNNLALVKLQPRLLGLKQIIEYFVEHRHEVVTRRTRFELRKAEERAHILEGLRIAVGNIDEIVSLIKSSASTEEAHQRLVERFHLSDAQARAILEMRLARLTGLEREKIEAEYRELQTRIADLTAILDSRDRRMDIVKDELRDLKARYADERRTEIVEAEGDVEIEDMIADEDMVITMTNAGYVKRTPVAVYRSQGRGGRGVRGMESKEDDFVWSIFVASAHSHILFFTNTGRCYRQKVYRIPEAGRYSRGRSIANLLQLRPGEFVAAVVPVKEFDGTRHIICATAQGVVNKQPLQAYSNVRRDGINAVSLDESDRLIEVRLTDGDDDVIIGTRNGQAVRFHESAARELGRNTRGVKGISLRGDDRVVGMVVVEESNTVLTVTEKGYGKRTAVTEYRRTNRGGTGIINIRQSERNGHVVAMKSIRRADTDVMLISRNGIVIRSDAERISLIGRNAQGVRLMNLSEGDTVVGVALCDREDAEPVEGGEENVSQDGGDEGEPGAAGDSGTARPDEAEGPPEGGVE